LNISPGWIIVPVMFQGFGLGMIFVPLSAVAFSTLAPHLRAEAAGLFSLLRTIGSSIGISITATLLTRHGQISWNELGGFITPYNPAVAHFLQSLHLSLSSPLAIQILMKTLNAQAQMIAFVDMFAFITWSFVLMLPLLLFIKKGHHHAETSIISE
jgi:DHA2 family multidrug resistance protein